MRIPTEIHLETTDGLIALCDAGSVQELTTKGARYIQVIPGRFEIFAGQSFVIVNVSPHVYDGSDWDEVVSVGTVDVPSGALCLLDGSVLPPQLADEPICHFQRFPFRHLTAWVENPDYSGRPDWDPFAIVLGVGAEVRPVLAGPHATQIHRMEKRLAEAMRSKGAKKQQLLTELREEARALVAEGVDDRRLHQMGSVLDVDTSSTVQRAPGPAPMSDFQALIQKAKETYFAAIASVDDDEQAKLYEKSALYFSWAAEIQPLPKPLEERAEKARRLARKETYWDRKTRELLEPPKVEPEEASDNLRFFLVFLAVGIFFLVLLLMP